MSIRCIASWLLLCGSCVAAQAAPGDPFVPAHRTKDGHYVPPNVPPLSAGTRLAKQPGRSAPASRSGHASPSALASPVLTQARSLPR